MIGVLGRAGLWDSGEASVLVGPTVGAADPIPAPALLQVNRPRCQDLGSTVWPGVFIYFLYF